MRRLGDYRCEMRTTRRLDREIERLLTGAPLQDRDLALLTPLVEGLRSLTGHLPPETEVRSIAARAAAVVLERSPQPTDAAASHRRRQRVGLTPRLAAMTMAVLMVPAMAGAALAADSAIPGDPLYGLDRAFEVVGIGAGSTSERLLEAAQMAAQGRGNEAINHAVLALESDGDSSNVLALQALESIAGFAGDDRSELMALLAYISENAGRGVGADGSEFGRGVAELAREIAGENGAGDNPATGGPDFPTTDPNGPPAVNPGQGQQPLVGQSNSNGEPGNNGAQNENGAQNGTGNGNAGTTGNTANPNGNGDAGPPDDVSKAPPAVDKPADPVAPDSGGTDADEGNEDVGQGNEDVDHGNEGVDQGTQGPDEGNPVKTKSPKPESPSLTAPGRLGASS